MKNDEKRPMSRPWFFRTLNALPGIDTEYRYDFETKTSRSADGKSAPRRVRGLKLK